jgi:hypothetical protein
MYGTPEERKIRLPYIPESNWAQSKIVPETDDDHGWSTFGTGMITTLTPPAWLVPPAWLGKLGRFGGFFDKADDAARTVAPKGLPATTADSVADKLRRYLLDPNHPIGGDKATWFRKALGLTQDNLDDLARQIKFDPTKAIATELTQHGQKFEQVIQIVGANGKRIDVLFVWIRNNDGVVRLVTSTLGV